MDGVGVVFDIDALGSGFYGHQAWRIFMRNLAPDKIVGCRLMEGDTEATLRKGGREFCIAVFGEDLDVKLVRDAFAECTDAGLAPPGRRFLDSAQAGGEPLMVMGSVDSEGRLVQDEWTRVDHDRCKECGWGYRPMSVPPGLPSELLSELDGLQRRALSPVAREEIKKREDAAARRREEEKARDQAQAQLRREEAERRRTEAEKRRVEERNRLEEEKARRIETDQRQLTTQERRRAAHECVMCGRGLGLTHRLRGKDRHDSCTVFRD